MITKACNDFMDRRLNADIYNNSASKAKKIMPNNFLGTTIDIIHNDILNKATLVIALIS